MIKNLLILVFVVLLLQSCVEVKFAEPQPRGIKNLDVFPEAFQGQYLLSEKDTILILKDAIVLLNDSSLEKGNYSISENLILRKWKKTYFINVKEQDDSLWTVFF